MIKGLALPVVFLTLMWPMTATAQEGLLSVLVKGLPTGDPVTGASADLWVQGRIVQPTLTTDGAGRLAFDLRRVADAGEEQVSVTLTLTRQHFRRVDLTRVCRLRGSPDCADLVIEMEPAAGSSAISANERDALERLVSNVGTALFLLPYETLPGGRDQDLSLDLLATSLDRAITTRIQALERPGESGGRLDPLPPISLVPVDSPQLAVSPTNFEKLRAIGQHVQALAVISGSAFAPAEDRVEVSSNFLIIPGRDEQLRQRQRVDDRGLPMPLNPFDLESRLSPAWAYNTLLALGMREYALARQTGDRDQLMRVYGYLVAARSDATGREGVELRDLNALITLIEAELEP